MAHLLAPTSYQIIHRLHTSQPSLLLLPYIFWVESLENVGQKGLQFTFSTTYIQKKMDYLLSNRYRRRKASPLSPLFGKGHTQFLLGITQPGPPRAQPSIMHKLCTKPYSVVSDKGPANPGGQSPTILKASAPIRS